MGYADRKSYYATPQFGLVFVTTYPPRVKVSLFGSCRNKPVLSELINQVYKLKYSWWKIRFKYQISNSWDTNIIKCKCFYGFSDIDECKGNHYCHMNAICTNTHGSYVCDCQPGFNGNGQCCSGEFNLFAVIFRIFLLESNLKLLGGHCRPYY